MERATTFLPILRVDGKDIYRDGFDTNGNVIPTLQLTSLNPAGPAMGALTGALDRAFDGGLPAGGVLTAEWLEIVSTIPGETDRVYEREILDRIGVENRTSGAKKDLKPGYQDDKRLRYLLATQQSILIETAFFGSAFVVDSVISTTQRRSTMLAASRAATPASPRYDDAWNNELSTELLALSTTAKGLGDQLVAREYPNARFYHARPGILTFKTKLDIATDGDIVIQRGFDIVENTMRTVSPDGRTSLPELALALGVIETHAERILASDFNESLFNALADPSDAPAEFGDVIQPVSVVDLFEAGRKAGISSVVVGPGRLGNFAQLNVSPEGTERIRQDVSHGYVVLAPRANVEMGGRSTIGWWRIDPVTGTTLGMMESGEGQAATEYSTVNSNRGAQIVSLLKFLGKTACVFLTVAGLLSIALLAYNIATGQVELNEQLAASLAVGMVLGQITGSACNRLFKRQGRCFAAGTPVQVALRPGVGSENGILSFVRGTEEITTRPIEQIAPGDLVLSRGEYSQTTKLKRVLRTTRRVAPEVLTLTLAQTAGGQVVERITTTPEHLFYVSTQGFVEARQLGIGTSIVTRAGPSLTISAIQRLHRAEGYKVYNLEVEEDHTYFAGRTGLWVHNRYRFTKVNPAKFPKGEKQGVQDTISAIKKNPNQAEANWWSRTKTREPKWGSPYKNRGIIDPATGEPRPGTQLPPKTLPVSRLHIRNMTCAAIRKPLKPMPEPDESSLDRMEKHTIRTHTMETRATLLLSRFPNRFKMRQPRANAISSTAIVVSAICALSLGCSSRQPRSEPDYGLSLASPALGGKLESEANNGTGLKEMIFSFRDQREASINAVVINPSSPEVLKQPNRMPKEVSVMVSMANVPEKFTRIAKSTLTLGIGEQAIAFAATKAKYVKVRILSTYGGEVAPIREVKISEASPRETSILAGDPLDLAAADLGGEIESITGEYGPGYNGRLLIDARSDTVWKAGANTFPQEIVISFFNRQPARISSVEIAFSPNAGAGPKELEVWTSMESPADGYQQAAALELQPGQRTQVVSFPAVEARFVKLRVLSSIQAGPLEIAEIRVPEAQGAGYTPLAKRNREMLSWMRRPTQAAQHGIDWLQPASIDWQNRNHCFGVPLSGTSSHGPRGSSEEQVHR